MIFLQKAHVLSLLLLLSPPCVALQKLEDEGFPPAYPPPHERGQDYGMNDSEQDVGKSSSTIPKAVVDDIQARNWRGLETRESAHRKRSTRERVIGGSYAPPNEYGWFARGVRKEGYVDDDLAEDVWHGCGGSLVTPEFVLTAAHCGFDETRGFQIGALCEPYKEDDNCGQNIETFYAKQVFDHPKYDDFYDGYDFTLVQLLNQSTIEPVPMDQGNVSTSYLVGQPLWVIGVGTSEIEYDGNYIVNRTLPDRLKHAEIPYVDSDKCTEIIESYGVPWWIIQNNSMCAGPSTLPEPDEGGCYGDSGGPLYDKEENVLVGVVSGGVKCGEAPGVYSRIADQWHWIRDVICNHHSEMNLPDFCIGYTTYPSSMPSTSVPTTTPSGAPSFAPCEEEEMTVEVAVYTDSYPYEISWAIIDFETGQEIVGISSYRDAYRLNKHQYCFPTDVCLRFEMKDSCGNGIYEPGGYNLTVDGVLLATSYDDVDFGYSSRSHLTTSEYVRFGDGCVPTESPTAIPSLTQSSSPSYTPCNIDEMEVKVNVYTDIYSSETSWDITDISTGEKLAGVERYDYSDLYKYRYCFPSDECLRFEMKDSYGDGIYLPYGYNFTVDDVLLATSFDDISGDFDYSESVRFGDGCVPTQSPTTSPPSSSPSYAPCEDGEMTARIDLFTDYYYWRKSWDIIDTETGEQLAGVSSYYTDRYRLYDYQYCFPSDGCLKFEMRDSSGDGFQLPYGYNFTVDDVVLATSYADVDFGYSSRSHLTTSEYVRFGDGCVPTESPTAIPSLTQSSSPSYTPCNIDDMEVKVNVYTDTYSSETSWDITDISTGEKLAGVERYDYSDFILYKYRYCFPSDECLRFEMKDSFGDGIYLPYGYNFTVDDVLLATSFDDISGDFDYSESVMFGFGDGCPASSYAPSNLPSSSPTAYCVDDVSFRFPTNNINDKGCKWLTKKHIRKLNYCNVKPEGEKKKIKFFCREACRQFIPRCVIPTAAPTTSSAPSMLPTKSPSVFPSKNLSMSPSTSPSISPSSAPSSSPSASSSSVPSSAPSSSPTMIATSNPSSSPSISPSSAPSSSTTMIPTASPIKETTVECIDNDEITFVINNKKTKDCKWLSAKSARAKKYCEEKLVLNENGKYSKIKFACRATCKKYLPRCS